MGIARCPVQKSWTADITCPNHKILVSRASHFGRLLVHSVVQRVFMWNKVEDPADKDPDLDSKLCVQSTTLCARGLDKLN